MARLPRTRADRLWPLGLTLLAFAACTPTQQVAFGPQPAPCTDSVAARVARLPAESVTVADRERALWAQEQCKVALDSQARAAAQPVPAATGASGPAHAGGAATVATWPPPACKDSIAARVARMPADSVSAADRQHAEAARLECERALTAPPPSASNVASRNRTAALLIAGAVIVVMMLVL